MPSSSVARFPALVRLLGLVLVLGAARPLHADGDAPQSGAPVPDAWFSQLAWRSIGPANMGGRITAIACDPRSGKRFWVATASGGLLFTDNGGQTFEHQFDRQSTVSIGDVAVSPAAPDTVWVGTGEANPRNSVSWGDGVYKSADGGKTWARVGLEASFQTGQIALHPTEADTAYVGALGRLWGRSEERGLYKTTDGGKTWTRLLHVDDGTGVVDVKLSPADPETVLAATWERQRDGFDVNEPAKAWGPGSGIWRSTDGGSHFVRVEDGLPGGSLGRIGMDFARSKPGVVYAIVESERTGTEPPDSPFLGINGEDAEVGIRLTAVVEGGPAAQAGLQKGDILIAVDGETTQRYRDFLKAVRRHVAGETVQIEASRKQEPLKVDLTLGKRPEPKEDEAPDPNAWRRTPFSGSLGGQAANMQDEQGKEGHEYGGVYRSDDAGRTWQRVNSLDPRPMYFSEIRVDPQDENHLYVLGIRVWESKDGGKTFEVAPSRAVHPDHHALFIDPADPTHMILGNDGGIYVTEDAGRNWDHLNHVAIGQFYHVGVDSRLDYRVYGGLQDNGSWGGPSLVRHGSGPSNRDWFRVGGGDGFRCMVDEEDPDQVYFEMQYGGLGRRHLATGEGGSIRPRDARETRYRFNWNTPYILSHHNSRLYYVAGNRVLRSLDRGRSLRAISPEITRTDRGTATALAESPLDPDLLYVGSDDGALWASRDGGHTWIDLFAPPAPEAAESQPKAPAGEGPDTGQRAPGDAGTDGDENESGAAAVARRPRARPGGNRSPSSSRTAAG